MRNCLIIPLFILSFFYTNAQIGSLERAVKTLYRVNPFGISYSTFVKTVMNDPDITNKSVTYKTDSSLFKFQGFYKKYNPFNLNVTQLRIQLLETPVHYIEKKPAIDTIIAYCMIGYMVDNEENRKQASHYLERQSRKFTKYFKEGERLTFNITKDKKEGAEFNFFNNYSVFAPLTIGWEKKAESNQLLFYTIARIKYLDNKVVEPMYRYAN